MHPHFLSTGLIDLLLGYATVAEMGQGGHGHKEDEDTNNMHPCLLLVRGARRLMLVVHVGERSGCRCI